MRLSGGGSHQSKRGKREKHCVLKSREYRIRHQRDDDKFQLDSIGKQK